jgi:hypothetical protein
MENIIKGKCSACGFEGSRAEFKGISDSPFCRKCIAEYQAAGWIKPSREHPNIFLLTSSGEQQFPRMVVVAYCPNDATRIYRRWVEAGIARAGDDPACPWCMGRDSEIFKHMM